MASDEIVAYRYECRVGNGEWHPSTEIDDPREQFAGIEQVEIRNVRPLVEAEQ